jgi:diguanylate cyclase (GGDEF)-like protein/PAS domain S-box-containing protein
MDKIYLMVKHKINYELLAGLLAENYEIITPGEKEWNSLADLVIVDFNSISENLEKLSALREKIRPVHLPCLLMVTEGEKKKLNQFILTAIDELLVVPTEKLMIQVRIENLLHLRRLSLETERRYQDLFQFIDQNVPVGITILQNERIVYANQALSNMLKKNEMDLYGINYLEFIHPHYKDKLSSIMKGLLSGENLLAVHEVKLDDDEKECWVDLRFSSINYNNVPSLIASVLDITERKQFERELKYLSLHDQVTGIYNRHFFEEELQRVQKGRNFPVSVLIADLNGLKIINDSLGHQKGDELLRACAEVLQASLRGSDIVARVGGDEFAILLQDADEKDCEAVIRRIDYNLELHNKKNPELPVSIATGSATAKKQGVSLEDVYGKADEAMYRDKLGRGEGERAKILDTLLAVLNEKDFIIEGHAHRLSELCQKVGGNLSLPKEKLNNLSLLAQTHEIGKIGIPEQILTKEGPLDEEEWEIMRQSYEKGHRIALATPSLSDIADLILKHHERWDGNGYPLQLSENDIPIECRILAVVDAYDAMTNDRPYRSAMSKAVAIREIEINAGKQFDPVVVDTFISVLEQENGTYQL